MFFPQDVRMLSGGLGSENLSAEFLLQAYLLVISRLVTTLTTLAFLSRGRKLLCLGVLWYSYSWLQCAPQHACLYREPGSPLQPCLLFPILLLSSVHALFINPMIRAKLISLRNYCKVSMLWKQLKFQIRSDWIHPATATHRGREQMKWSLYGCFKLSQQAVFRTMQMNTNFTNHLSIKLLLKVVAKGQNCGFSFPWRS